MISKKRATTSEDNHLLWLMLFSRVLRSRVAPQRCPLSSDNAKVAKNVIQDTQQWVFNTYFNSFNAYNIKNGAIK